MKHCIWVVVLCLLSGVRGRARAQCDLAPGGVLGGTFSLLAPLADRRIAAVKGDTIELYDLSAPATPVLLDRALPAGSALGWWGQPTQMVSTGATVCALKSDRVSIFDGSGGHIRLTAVHQVRNADGVRTSGCAIAAENGLLYVIGTSFVQIVDISNPQLPVVLRTNAESWPCASGVGVRNGFLYVKVGDTMQVLNTATMVTTQVPLATTSCTRAVVSGPRVFIQHASDAAMDVYGLSNPALPNPLGTTPVLAACPPRVAVSGAVSYYVEADNRLTAADLSDPSHPVVLGRAGPELVLASITVVDASVLVGLSPTGAIEVVDTSNPASPSRVATITDPYGTLSLIAEWDGTLWTIVGGTRLVAFDVSEIDRPVRVSELEVGGTVDGLAITDGVACVFGRWNQVLQLRLIDVHDRLGPVVRGALGISYSASLGPPRWFEARPGVVALKDTPRSQIKLIDTSNPDAPRMAGTISLGQAFSFGMAFQGATLFVANSSSIIRAYDTSAPDLPVQTGSFEAPGAPFFQFNSLAAANEVLIAGTNNEIQFFGSSEPSALVNLGVQETTSASIAFDGDGVWTGSTSTTLQDLSDPARPFTRVGLRSTIRLAAGRGVALLPGCLAVTRSNGNLTLFAREVDHLPGLKRQAPSIATPCIGEPFEVTVEGIGPPDDVTYQWFHDLNRPIAGATSGTLAFDHFTARDIDDYFCIVTNSCGSVRTPFATSVVRFRLCIADFNCDGFADFFDFGDFVDRFAAGDIKADVNGDDFLDFFDFDQFVGEFERGC